MQSNHQDNKEHPLDYYLSSVPPDFHTHIEPKLDIGEVINKALNERFDSVRSFADSIDKTHALVLRVLNGEENYTINTLLTILSGLGLKIKIEEEVK